MVPILAPPSQEPRALDVQEICIGRQWRDRNGFEHGGVWSARARRYNDSVHHRKACTERPDRKDAMYIGIGTVVVILIILLLIGVLR